MTTKLPSSYVGKQLYVGSSFPDPKGPTALGIGPAAISGSAYIAGPAIAGTSASWLFPEASLMVSRTLNPHALALVPSLFKVSTKMAFPSPFKGTDFDDVVLGDTLGPVGVKINSIMYTQLNASTWSLVTPLMKIIGVRSHVGINVEIGAEVKVSKRTEVGTRTNAGTEVINGTLIVNGPTIVNGLFYAARATWATSIVGVTKLFDIVHPSKPKHRLAHACVEGPEFGVYHRGKLDGSNIIELPDYWKGLVDYDTITVNLTPFGRSDNSLHVKEITEDKIIVSSDHLVHVKCFYHLYAERKDVDKLIVEYEGGDSPQDAKHQGGPRE